MCDLSLSLLSLFLTRGDSKPLSHHLLTRTIAVSLFSGDTSPSFSLIFMFSPPCPLLRLYFALFHIGWAFVLIRRVLMYIKSLHSSETQNKRRNRSRTLLFLLSLMLNQAIELLRVPVSKVLEARRLLLSSCCILGATLTSPFIPHISLLPNSRA
jgi:hypothetical protein